MTSINITPAFQASIDAVVAAGKTPWFIINADYAVGVYGSRTEARNAKAEGNLEGKIVKQDEVEMIIVPVGGVEIDCAMSHKYACPSCGINLSNGVGVHGDEVNGKIIHHDHYEYVCLACGEEFGPAIKEEAPKADKKPEDKKVIEKTEKSTTDRPCKQVWHIADSMPGAKRKDVLEACVAKGIAYNTARTQYQQWYQLNVKAK